MARPVVLEVPLIEALDVKDLDVKLYRQRTGPCARLPKDWGEGCLVRLVLREYGKSIPTPKGGDRRVRVASQDFQTKIRGVKGLIRGHAMIDKRCRGYGQSPMAWIPTGWGNGCSVLAVLLEKGAPIGDGP